jgi:cyanophycinase
MRNSGRGHLVIIGGAEDRTGDMVILRRFVELTDRDDPQIAVLTAASEIPDIVWGRYDEILTGIGVRRRQYVSINAPEDCNDPALIAQIMQSDGVLVTGGDQRRLMSLIGGTALEGAILYAHQTKGTCIAGTSAGAAAMSRYMLAGRSVSEGIGLVRRAIIDQHFSQRNRLGRLVSAIAARPQLIGVGIDENTALVLTHGRGIDVIGEGGITLVDGRRLPHQSEELALDTLMRLPELQVMQLAQGSYRMDAGADAPPEVSYMLSML